MKRRWKVAAAAIIAVAVAVPIVSIGPRNIIGMLRYDQREEGALRAGDKAPDVSLASLDGGQERLQRWIGRRPLVLIFGSFT